MSLSARSLSLAGVLAIAAPLALAATADAAKLSVKDTRITSTSDLNFKAARGEANRVRFDVKAKRVTVTDPGAKLKAGRGCTSVSTHRVVCRTHQDEFYYYNVNLGDRNDRAFFVQRKGGELAIPAVNAGRGDDVVQAGRLKRYGILSGGDGDDRITGTKDSDAISGGAGEDVLVGGRGDDQFEADPAGSSADDDQIRGGAGEDSVSYSRRTRPISIDLRRSSPQGSAGEKDVYRSVEGVTGTVRDDKLLGNGSDNDLQGIGGRDVIQGFAGDDRVWGEGGKRADRAPDTISGDAGADIVIADAGGTATGGPGDDEFQGTGTLDGGDGDDLFDTVGGQVQCGNGDDRVSITNTTPPALVACEGVDLGRNAELSMTLPLERGANDIVANLFSCDQEDGPTEDAALCQNEIQVFLGEQLLANGTYDASDQNVTVHMPYRDGAKEALGADPKQVRVTVGRYSFFTQL